MATRDERNEQNRQSSGGRQRSGGNNRGSRAPDSLRRPFSAPARVPGAKGTFEYPSLSALAPDSPRSGGVAVNRGARKVAGAAARETANQYNRQVQPKVDALAGMAGAALEFGRGVVTGEEARHKTRDSRRQFGAQGSWEPATPRGTGAAGGQSAGPNVPMRREGQTGGQVSEFSSSVTAIPGVRRYSRTDGTGVPAFSNIENFDPSSMGGGNGDAAAAILARNTPQLGEGPAGQRARARGNEPGMGGGRAVMIGGGDNRLEELRDEIGSVASQHPMFYGGEEGKKQYLQQLGNQFSQLAGLQGKQLGADTALATTRMGEQGAMQRAQMKLAGGLQRAVQEGRMSMAEAQQTFQREQALQQQQAALERGNKQYEFENDPRVAASAANTRDEMMSRRTQDALDYMNLDAETNQAVLKALSDPTTRDAMLQFIDQQFGFQPQERRANGGMIGGPMMDDAGNPVEMFAGGGAVGAVTPFGQSPEAEDMIPGMRQYGQYVATAAENGVEPVGPDEFMNLLAQGRAARQNPAGASQVNLAQGGPVPGGDFVPGTEDVDGAMVLDQTRTPDMAGSDNIPAVIDGERPAALTSGEYVIPAEIVKIKGTEFFDNLLAKYMQDDQQGATPARGQGKPQGQARGMT